MENIYIRNISNDDIEAVNSLYNHYIRETAFTFDIKEKTLSEKKEWYKIFKKDSPYQCIVAYENDILIGFASSRPFRDKEAYNSSIETSVYISENYIGKGYGRLLMEDLFNKIDGYHLNRAYAFITEPNNASEKLHLLLGFEKIGVLNNVGKKFGKFWNVGIFEYFFE
jgi:phosphinothricin acetyltransferase